MQITKALVWNNMTMSKYFFMSIHELFVYNPDNDVHVNMVSEDIT